MKRVLTGLDASGQAYTEDSLYGLIAQMYYKLNGHLPRQNDVTVNMTGSVVTNATTGDVGYIIDSDSQYFALLPTIHADRLVDVVDGDGWCDTGGEV